MICISMGGIRDMMGRTRKVVGRGPWKVVGRGCCQVVGCSWEMVSLMMQCLWVMVWLSIVPDLWGIVGDWMGVRV